MMKNKYTPLKIDSSTLPMNVDVFPHHEPYIEQNSRCSTKLASNNLVMNIATICDSLDFAK